VSADGRLYALGSERGTVRLLDLRSGAVRNMRGRHESPVLRLAFTPDNGTLVTTSEDGEVLVWDVEQGEVRERLEGHTGETQGLALSRSGATAYTAALDGRTNIWDLAGARRLARPFSTGAPFVVENDEFPKELAITPDGGSLAVAQSNGHVDFFDTRTLRRKRTVKALSGFAAAVDVSRDGRMLAVTGEGGELRLFDARTLRPVGELPGMRSTSQAVTFSPNGRLVAAGELGLSTPGGDGAGGRVHIWDAPRGTGAPANARVSFRLMSPSLSFSPDGRLLAAAGFEEPSEVREVANGKLVARLKTSEFGRSVAFSPDRRLLATGLYDGRIELWSTETWKQVGRALEGQTGRVISLEFSPDGRTLATSSADGTVVLWEVASRKQVGAPLTVLGEARDAFVSAQMAPDGRHVFATSAQGPASRWAISPEAWKAHACRVAGRDLTAREWREALPERAQQSICGGDGN
jgi:WD40 repeat protein